MCVISNMQEQLRGAVFCSARYIVPATLVAFCCLTPSALTSVRADGPTVQYFEELRQRRLFGLAEGYCLQRLSKPELDPSQRVVLTLELSRTFGEHAKHTVGDEQAELWQRAKQIVDEFLSANPSHPRRLLVEVQRASVSAARGEFLSGQAELSPHNDQLPDQAQGAFAEAVSQLEKLEATLRAEAGRAARSKSVEEQALTSYELRKLADDVQYQLGRALLGTAKLLPSDSHDRVSTLREAEQWLRRLAGGTAEEELTWNSRILLAEASRLRSDFKQAARMLKAIEQDNPPPEVRDRLAALRTRVLLDLDRPEDAAEMLIQYRRQRGTLSGELRFLQTKVLLALWKIAEHNDEESLADDLLKQAESHVGRVELELGGYWASRCRLLMEVARESQKYGSEAASLIREAQALYTAGQIDEAIEAYRNAADLAERNDRPELATELTYTRASIVLEAGRYQDAANSFRELADSFPADRRAADAHLLGAYALGRLYDQRRTKSRREAYTEALIAHRKRFADGPTAAEATWMLARLEERRLQATRALSLYQEIPADHRRGPDAQVAVARCYEIILDRVRELGRPTASWEKQAVEQLDRIVATFSSEPENQSLHEAEVVLRLARIHLNRDPPEFTEADGLLEQLFPGGRDENTPSDPSQSEHKETEQTVVDKATRETADEAAWKRQLNMATQLRVISLAGQGRWSEAESLVEHLSAAGPVDVLNVLDGLMQLSTRARDVTRRGLGELQLKAADKLRSRLPELNEDERRRFDRCLAQAYVATQQPRRAVEVYEALLAESPRDREMLQTAAELLVECGTRDCLSQAKTHWRTLESLESAGSPAWLRARYQVAWCSFALKEYDECRKLLGVTRLLYPDLGGDELRKNYAELEQALDAEQRQ